MSNYLIELSVIHSALMLGYWLFLKKERQYSKMRFFLLASTFLALTIPLLKLPRLLFTSTGAIDVPMQNIQIGSMAMASATDAPSWTYENLLIPIYIAGSLFFLFKFLSGILFLIALARKSSAVRFNDISVRKDRNIKGSFTFFNWIFLSHEIDEQQGDYDAILKHEKAHVSLGHSYDLMFFELFKVCFWWLPTAWLIDFMT